MLQMTTNIKTNTQIYDNKQDNIDKIIFGKDLTERIVNIEIDESDLILFIENQDGTISHKFLDYTYWALSPVQRRSSSKRLKGNLFYKWITKFNNIDDFQQYKKLYYTDFSIYDLKESAMVYNGLTYYKGMKVSDVSTLSFDIETTGLKHNKDSKVLLISNTFRKNGKIIKKLFAYDEYNTDADFFNAWCTWVREMNPSIILGHNIFGYDLPYLNFCAKNAGTELYLGRDQYRPIKFNKKASKFRKDGSQKYDYFNAHIFGREIIDTFFLSLKYDISRKYVSYGLKQIIKQEALEKKDRQFYDASTIKNNYKNQDEWRKIKAYAMDDADDALALYDLMINSYFYYAQSIPKSFQSINNSATGSQLNSFMIRAYLQDGKSIPKSTEAKHYEGAISFGNPGIYKNVLKVDVASLYPSIMIEYNVYDKKKDPDKIFLQTVRYFTKQRLENKQLAKTTGDRHYKDLEQAQKIVINSLYGFMGASGLLFNSPDNAAFVTRKGREILSKGIEWVNNKEYQLINVDTDSFSYSKGYDVDDDEFKKDLEEINLLFPSNISWENDGKYKTVICIKAKNYVLYDGTKIKYKGSALRDQKKEPALGEMLKKILQHILDNDNINIEHIYKQYIKEAMNIKDINRWCVKKTITESVLNSDKDGSRLNERKVLDAMNESKANNIIEDYQEGDKIWVYDAINGEIQKTSKGELLTYKDGTPKMVPNNILKVKELWNNDENKTHYIKRVYQTIKILQNILNMDEYIDYTLKKNNALLEKLLDT